MPVSANSSGSLTSTIRTSDFFWSSNNWSYLIIKVCLSGFCLSCHSLKPPLYKYTLQNRIQNFIIINPYSNNSKSDIVILCVSFFIHLFYRVLSSFTRVTTKYHFCVLIRFRYPVFFLEIFVLKIYEFINDIILWNKCVIIYCYRLFF